MTPGLARYVEMTQHGLRVHKPVGDLARQALLVTLLLPLASGLLAGALVVRAGALDGGPTMRLVAGLVIGAATTVPFLVGLVQLALAPLRSRRSWVEIDRAAGTLRRADGRVEPLAGVASVTVAASRTGWLSLTLVRQSGDAAVVRSSLE